MKQIGISRTVLCMLSLCLAIGCGGSDEDQTSSSPDKTGDDKGKLEVVDVKDLPKTTDLLPEMDGDRIRIGGPAGWLQMPRSGSGAYVCGFKLGKASALPQMLLIGEPAEGADFQNADKDNVEAFTAVIEKYLDDKYEKKSKKIKKEMQVVLLGDRPWAAIVRPAVYKNVPAERLYLMTVGSGKLYTIKLEVFVGGMAKLHKVAYASAASMEFLTPTAAEPAPDMPSLDALDDPPIDIDQL